jgi:CheY-like chemotaxis protein
VFDMFVQGERTLDRSQGGLGIGLCVVKRLMEMHDGSVIIRSAGERRGTQVELRLPLLLAGTSGRELAPVARGAARRILVVDDNEDAANTLAMILKLDGHEVETAFSGHEALERAAGYAPEVMLLDIGLPGLDGYEVAQRIRAQPRFRDLRLIAITGYGQNADRLRTQEAGFAGHLVKPVEFAELKRVLAALPVDACNANT